MRGLGKFLFGGLLGALFGFFVSPKRAQLVRDALVGQGAPVGPATPRALETPRGVVHEPEPEPPLAPEPTLEPEPPLAPEPTLEPEPPPEPESTDAFEPQWAEPEDEVPAASPPAQVGFDPVFSISKPSLPADVADHRAEEPPTPVLEVESIQPEPGEAELEPELEREPEAVEADVELEPQPEAEEAEVELEHQPEVVAAEAEPEPESAEAELEGEPESVEHQETGLDSVSDWESAREPKVPPVTIGMSDLKTRIEETRRRIQRELEQPFATEREALVADEAPTFGEQHPVRESEEVVATSFGFESFTEPEMDQVPVVEESAVGIETYEFTEAPTEPVMAVEEQTAFEPPEEAVIEAPVIEEEAPSAPLGSDSEFDHDAMRRRIEETRNRLKAKAFDAMMKGESALLAQDADASTPDASSSAEHEPLDSELAETIDTTLSEEDI